MDQMCGSDEEKLELGEVIEKVVKQLSDPADNGPADKDLTKWYDEWRAFVPPA